MRFLIVLFIIFFQAISSFSQVTFIPDTNFRKFLKDKFPTYLDANGNLIDANAASYTGVIDCNQLKIKNLKGIEKFSKITSLACQNNELENIDSIAKLSNLQFLYCYNNLLTHLPDLSKLTKLAYLSCGTNKLTYLPDLSKNTPLFYLDCSRNQVMSISGLDKLINLQSIFIFENRLNYLPSLANLTKLFSIVAHKNQLSDLPGLENLTQLVTLIAGDNPYLVTPKISGLTKIQILMLWNSQMTQLPDISQLKFLKKLVLDGNDLNFLPDLSQLAFLDTLNVENNYLTFEDLILVNQNSKIRYFNYIPQKKSRPDTIAEIKENDKFIYNIKTDQSILSNKYAWYKNGVLNKTTTLGSYQINTVSFSDSGSYSYQVSNPNLPNLTLYSSTITLKVTDCLDLNNLFIQTSDFDCNTGARIIFNPQTVNGGKTPYSFFLKSKNSDKILLPNGNLFGNLYENSYLITVQSQDGCAAEKEIIITGNRPDDCNGLVIVADNASNQNELFLNDKGNAKVYDKDGKLVQSFSTPGSWDGKNNQGEFLPGLYFVDLNGKTLRVTLIK